MPPEAHTPTTSAPQPRRSRKLELLVAAVFVVVNLLAPLVMGERYPFTVSPMFSDHPSQYCVYEVFDSAGAPVELEPLGLHLVYDGNPPGLGMGIAPTPTLHEFGVVPGRASVVAHVGSVLQQQRNDQTLTVRQTVVRLAEHRPQETVNEWTISALSDGSQDEPQQ